MQKLIILAISLLILFLQRLGYQNYVQYKNYNEVNHIFQWINSVLRKNYYNATDLHSRVKSKAIKQNRSYCLQSDPYKYFHPDVVLQDIHQMRETWDLTKEIINTISYDNIPALKKEDQEWIVYKQKVPNTLTIPFNYFDWYFQSTFPGQSSMCSLQKHNHMPARQELAYKNKLINNFHLYQNKLKRISKQCSDNAQYIPQSFRLYKKSECKEFFKYITTEEYKQKFEQEGPQFISKLGLEVHRGKGINMLFEKELKELQLEYNNGEKCGKTHTFLIAQKYINNPYLFEGHKIEFRIYFIVASTNPMIVYAYDSSLIRRCAKQFDKFSLEKSSHVCNTAIVKQTINENNEDEQFYINWKLDYLQELLLKDKKIKNRNWLNQYLYPKIHKTIQHIILSAQDKLVVDSKLAEFFGVDFMLTNDFNVYVLEVNSNPQLLKTTPDRIKQNTKLVQDIMEIQVAYMRSRYIRIREFVKQLLQKKKIDYNKQEKQLHKIYQDKLESSINISSTNLFRKIIDKNYQGTKAYNDLIETKCLL